MTRGRPRGSRDRYGRAIRVDCERLRRSSWPSFCRSFGRRLEDEMRRVDVAASELAAAIGVSPMTVYGWRRGRSVPGMFVIAALATALRCSFDLLPDQAHDIGGLS
jgi:DNA-binding XRE family transcriptional regulator